jgi:class 3 adenylate cyclase/Tfp pilus assembly protein PilF
MTNRIEKILLNAGINHEKLPAVLEYIKHPPKGSVEWEDTSLLPDEIILLDVLIILTFDLVRFKDIVLMLLDQLIKDEEKLSDYDRGRLFHIKGYLDWRVTNSLYQASDALNRSLKILGSEKSGGASLYRARVHDTLGQILKSQGLLNDARDEYEKSLSLREGSDDDFGKAITLGNLGRLNFELGNFSKAIEYLTRDLKIAKKTGQNKNVEAQLLNTVARCHIEIDENPKARNYLKKSYEINKMLDNYTGLCYNYLSFATLSLHLNRLTEAEIYLEKISGMISKREIPSFLLSEIEAERIKMKAVYFHRKGEFEAAIEYYRQAIEVYGSSASFSPVEKSKLLYGLAQVLKKQGKKDEAHDYYRKSLRLLDTTEAFALRNAIEQELLTENKDSWTLHSAGRFIGHSQIDILLNEAGEEGFRGEQKTAAVLFCDINDFTSISEKFSPQDLILFLNEFFRLMTRSIEHYDGFVDKFIGDAVMAVFVAVDDSSYEIRKISKNACMAALLMNSELERFNRKRKPGIPAIKISTGIHIGETVAGLIGSPQKRSYTFMGDTVNTASRIEGIAKLLGAGILVSEQVFSQLDTQDHFLLRPAGKYNPKGKDQPLVVSEIMGINDNTSDAGGIKKEIEGVRECLYLFYKRNFSAAHKGFTELGRVYENSPRLKGYEFLASKAKSFLIDPPPENWDGEIRLFSK